jgi:hypothetical protein
MVRKLDLPEFNSTDTHLWRSSFQHKLEPHERDEIHFELIELYDMSAPGVYKILAIAHEATKSSGGTGSSSGRTPSHPHD